MIHRNGRLDMRNSIIIAQRWMNQMGHEAGCVNFSIRNPISGTTLRPYIDEYGQFRRWKFSSAKPSIWSKKILTFSFTNFGKKNFFCRNSREPQMLKIEPKQISRPIHTQTGRESVLEGSTGIVQLSVVQLQCGMHKLTYTQRQRAEWAENASRGLVLSVGLQFGLS